jgi:glycosyltransferase involved in cell wall biosynthesis
MTPNYHVVSRSRPGPVDFSVVIPAYNGAERLAPTLAELASALTLSGLRYEVIVVNDGSSDDTSQRYSNLVDVTLMAGRNQGKGAALRAGLASARGAVVGFIDVDGDYGTEALLSMYHIVAQASVSSVIGWRSGSHGSLKRLAMSKAFSAWVWLWHRINFDTQAGIKVFSRELLQSILPELTVSGFAIDVDLISCLLHAGYPPPVLYPVRLDVIGESSVNARRSLQALIEVAQCR